MRIYFLLLCLIVGGLVPARARGQASTDENTVFYGVGVRFRGLFVPRSVFERFVEVAPSGISKPELGIEAIRRRKHFDASVGIAWANISADDGIWVTALEDLDDNPSLIEFEDFSWVALDVNAVWRRPVHPVIALRYGLGIGLGIIRGEVLETDYRCLNNQYDLESCVQQPDATAVRKPLNIPSVVPIMNVILGVQYHPHDQVAINLDAGLQTALFVGLTVDYFFQKK